MSEKAINNSYQIAEEFASGRRIRVYRQPSKPVPMLSKRKREDRNGKVKIYTEEEIFLYKLQHCGREIDNER